jgi:hypothetical protein
MDSVHRSLLAFSIVHVRDDEALGERYKIVENDNFFLEGSFVSCPLFLYYVQGEKWAVSEKLQNFFCFLSFLFYICVVY